MAIPPITAMYITNTERIPLSLCCISGIALVINFAQCTYNCAYCPWEANLDARSARTISLDLDLVNSAIERYRPDIIFLSGSDLWKFEGLEKILEAVAQLDMLKGVKVISCPISSQNNVIRMYKLMEQCDVVLVEVCECSDVETFFNIINRVVRHKHIEVVVVGDVKVLGDIIDKVVDKLNTLNMLIPINLIFVQPENSLVYRFIGSIRNRYPLIHALSSPSTEFSSILCPNCRTPIVIRSGAKVLKLSIDDKCRCVYCGHRVISVERNICIARKMVKLPINIPLA